MTIAANAWSSESAITAGACARTEVEMATDRVKLAMCQTAHTPRRGLVHQGLPISSKIAASGHKTPSALSYTIIGVRLGDRGFHHEAKG
jgi:hypothetical protein